MESAACACGTMPAHEGHRPNASAAESTSATIARDAAPKRDPIVRAPEKPVLPFVLS